MNVDRTIELIPGRLPLPKLGYHANRFDSAYEPGEVRFLFAMTAFRQPKVIKDAIEVVFTDEAILRLSSTLDIFSEKIRENLIRMALPVLDEASFDSTAVPPSPVLPTFPAKCRWARCSRL